MERLKTVLVELPNFSRNGQISPDLFTMIAKTPSRALGQIAADLMYGIGAVKGVETDITIIDPRFNVVPVLTFADAKKAFSADIVGGSAISATIYPTIEFFKACKEYNPNIITILGGHHGTANDEEVLRTGAINYVVRGEGDFTAIELWRTIKEGGSLEHIQGISYLDKEGRYARNPDRAPMTEAEISLLPLPYNPPEICNQVTVGVVHTSVGCVYDCNFCTQGLMGGARNHRRGSMERAMRQMEMCYELYPNSSTIFIGDSNFAPKNDMDWVIEFFVNVEKEYGRLKNPKRLMPQIDIHAALYPGFLQRLKKAGGFAAYVGLESLSSETLKAYRKAATVKQIELAMERLMEEKIWGHCMAIEGGKGETVESQELMKKMLKKKAASAQILSLVPAPGTNIGEQLKREEKLLVAFDENHMDNYSLMNGHFILVQSPDTLDRPPYKRQEWLIKAHKEIYSRRNWPHLLDSASRSVEHLGYDWLLRQHGSRIVKAAASSQEMIEHLAFLASLP